MVNKRVEMSVYSIVISRHLLLRNKCMCHILTLVILFIVTTIINVVFFALSSCRRTELNCGNKENERRRDDFVHPFFFFLSRSLSPCVSHSPAFNEQNETETERGRKEMRIKPQACVYARARHIKKKNDGCCYC